MWYEALLKRGLISEKIIRLFLRIYYEFRFKRLPKDVEELQDYLNSFISKMNEQPIAKDIDIANEQHYELPTKFFKEILGEHMKYSCGYWQEFPVKANLPYHLSESELNMLELTCKRANIKNGDKILDLGCGWGSLCLYIKNHFQDTKITAVSNSTTQKEYIENLKKLRNVKNLEVITRNIADLELEEQFDVIVSIEMFEHIRNYQALLKKLHGFLKEKGKLFIHIFTDGTFPYFFDDDSDHKWMNKYFFSGGMMPSTDLLFYFLECFSMIKVWKVNGRHYQATLNAWLERMKSNKGKILLLLKDTYGKGSAKKWWNFWKLFFISLSEVFGFREGNQRFVTHYLMEKK